VLPFIHLFGLGNEIPNTKALFKEIGIFRSDEVRLPLLPCTRERLREVMLAYELCMSNSLPHAPGGGRPSLRRNKEGSRPYSRAIIPA